MHYISHYLSSTNLKANTQIDFSSKSENVDGSQLPSLTGPSPSSMELHTLVEARERDEPLCWELCRTQCVCFQ